MDTQYITKLTVKSLNAQPKKGSVKESTHICNMYGTINDKKVGTSDYGEFIRFKGDFEGVNVETGEAARSATLIVPPILQSMLDGAELPEGANLEFAVELWVNPSERSITGYEYTIKPLVEPEETETMKRLRQASQKALEAPKKKAS